jgi:hypothetical protein
MQIPKTKQTLKLFVQNKIARDNIMQYAAQWKELKEYHNILIAQHNEGDKKALPKAYDNLIKFKEEKPQWLQTEIDTQLVKITRLSPNIKNLHFSLEIENALNTVLDIVESKKLSFNDALEQWKKDEKELYTYILAKCHNSDDEIKKQMGEFVLQNIQSQFDDIKVTGTHDEILNAVQTMENGYRKCGVPITNEQQKSITKIYHQIFAILPESIRNTCKNADELERAFRLYKNISPYIAFNEDGKPIKVIDAFNAPSQGGVSRAQAVKMNFGYFIEDYTAIHDKETCERFVKEEVERKRLDNTEEAKEAFARVRKAVHSEVKKEFEKAYQYPSMVDSLIKKRMQERIDKNKALCVKKYQRFGESKGDQELLSDIQSVNEEVDRLTHSTQASTNTLKNTLKKYSSLVKNFGKKSEIDGYVKNLKKRSQTVVKKPVTHIQINLPAKRRLDAQTIMSQSKSNLSSSFFSKATTATSSPSQMTFRPNTQEDRAKNIIAKRQQMQKEFAHKYRENAQNNNV